MDTKERQPEAQKLDTNFGVAAGRISSYCVPHTMTARVWFSVLAAAAAVDRMPSVTATRPALRPDHKQGGTQSADAFQLIWCSSPVFPNETLMIQYGSATPLELVRPSPLHRPPSSVC